MKKISITCIVISLLCLPTAVFAKQWLVTPNQNLQAVLDRTQNGDTVILSAGVYQGNFVINQQISLMADGEATIDANGVGNAITLNNSHISIAKLNIINWGQDLTAQNAGIYSSSTSEYLSIEGNTLKGDAFGLWLQNTSFGKVINNTVEGNTELRSADRGNGIQLSVVHDMTIKNNRVSKVRDGLYIISSQNNLIENNDVSDLRYGVHYMYSYDNTVQFNHAHNTRAGYALMSSRRLMINSNTSDNSEDYGFLLNYITESTITKNRINHVWTKPENVVVGREGKGFFVYNSGYNTLSFNQVNHAEIGIHLTAGSENIKVYGNSFTDNPTQVKYVSNQKQEWSLDGVGNYWSNYLGWDMNNDNKGDVAFEPNDGIDKLLWQYPEMKILMDSPAILILRWVQRQFPVLKPPGVKDSFPLMSPLNIEYTNEALTSQDQALMTIAPSTSSYLNASLL